MKKLLTLALMLVLCLAVLAGCKCKHDWDKATCLEPKTCSECGETEGDALGHSWQDASCEAPRTCSECGETEGEALDHLWEVATCEAPKTCSRCGKTKGEARGHDWQDATCEAPKTCSECGKTEGDAAGHDWVEASYSAPKTCKTCAKTEGKALIRTDLGRNENELITVLDTTVQLLGYKLQYWGKNDSGWPVYDVLEASTGSYTNVFLGLEPNQDGSRVYGIYVCAEDVNDVNAVALMGAVAGVALGVTDQNFDADALSKTLSEQPTVRDGVAYYYMEDCGLVADLQVDQELAVFWIYPAE